MSEASDLAILSIRHHEGRVLSQVGHHVVYDDDDGSQVSWTGVCKGHPTIGWGHNLAYGIPEEVAWALLRHDVGLAEADCLVLFDNPPTLAFRFIAPVARQAVLIELDFCLGPSKMREFVRMIAAVRSQDYALAAAEILESKWARTVGDQPGQRAHVMAERMRTGEW